MAAMKKSWVDAGVVVKDGGTYLPINRMWYDYSRNLRIDYSDCKPNTQFVTTEDVDVTKMMSAKFNPGLYEDIMLHGILTPLDVSLLVGDELLRAHKLARAAGLTPKDVNLITCRGIRGHRRFYTLTQLHALYPKDERYSLIPVNIHEGLTYQQEMDLLVDQFGIKQLNACEIVNAIRVLRGNGLSEVDIAARINKSRGFVQRRLWIIGFPSFVFDAWVAYMLKKADVDPKLDLTDSVLVDLNKAATSDRKAGRQLDAPTSDFMKAWESIVHPVDENGEPVSTPSRESKSYSRADIVKMLDEQKNLDTIIRGTLEYVIKINNQSLNTLDSEAKTLRIKAAKYDELTAVKPAVVTKVKAKK